MLDGILCGVPCNACFVATDENHNSNHARGKWALKGELPYISYLRIDDTILTQSYVHSFSIRLMRNIKTSHNRAYLDRRKRLRIFREAELCFILVHFSALCNA